MKEEERIPIIKDFLKYCYHELQIKNAPKIRLHSDNKFVKSQTSFGGYYPNDGNIEVYIKNRNLADILRTLAHELVHHQQKELMGPADTLDGSDGSNYENEANSKAGVLLRKYGKTNPLIYESMRMMDLLEAEDTSKYQLYCDMDGVLCDFVAQFEHYYGTDPATYENEHGYPGLKNAIDKAGREFWAEMPWMSAGKRLWEKIGKHGVIILTSPSTFKDAKPGKLEWINLHLTPAPKAIIFRQTGEKHTILVNKSPEEVEKSVLIDDWNDNIIPWKKSGGVGILHVDEHPAHYQIDKLDLDSKEEPKKS